MQKEFSALYRNQCLNQLKTEKFDLLVIGGGINGAGVARDAASRGMKVALIEAQDFASGTSSRSSKLIHGGIRYLENLEFGLVFEALSERRRLFELAPHLVHPLRFVLPIYEHSRVGMFKMGMGMWLYDALSLFEAPELHQRLNPQQTMSRLPMLQANKLVGSYAYSDAYMDDDRLVLETLRSAHFHGATCLHYVQAKGARFSDDHKIKAVECYDQVSGQSFMIEAQHVVSTVGPWTDQLGHQIFTDWKNVLRPSKGIHFTLDRSRFNLSDAVVMAVDKEERIVFGIPRHDMVIIGTTDTSYLDDPRNVHSESKDVDYLLKIVDEYFPGAEIKKADILSTYAGVRPLVQDGAASEGRTSREHWIYSDPRNITFVAGGKYTTYRKIAESAVKVCLQNFSAEQKMKFAHSQTLEPLNPLVSASTYVSAKVKNLNSYITPELSLDDVELLVSRHGNEAFAMLEQNRHASLWEIEAEHAIQQTMCSNLVDFYLRRSPLFLSRRDHGLGFIDKISQVFVQNFNWTSAEVEAQKNQIKEHMALELSWQIEG